MDLSDNDMLITIEDELEDFLDAYHRASPTARPRLIKDAAVSILRAMNNDNKETGV